jgi:Xaa-Pro aminopeptidase
MSNYSDFVRDRSEEILRRTEPTPDELAEQAERARRNRLAEIMAPPAPPEKLTTQPASVDHRALERRLRSMGATLAKAFGKGMAEYVKKKLAPLVAEIERAKRAGEAVGRVADRVSTELAELKREAALQKRLDEARNQRRIESLETALLAAGRRPDQDTETEIPKMEWNGHAQ